MNMYDDYYDRPDDYDIPERYNYFHEPDRYDNIDLRDRFDDNFYDRNEDNFSYTGGNHAKPKESIFIGCLTTIVYIVGAIMFIMIIMKLLSIGNVNM